MPTRSIPWPRILAEGFAIVVSILLAFGIQAWWEERQERQEEEEILAGLEADFFANLEELAFSVAMHEDMVHRLIQLEELSDEDLAAIAPDSLWLYGRALWASGRTFQARDGTLDAILSSGKLDVLDDPQVRESLVEWKRTVEDTQEEADDFRAAWDRVIARLVQLGGPWSAPAPGTRFPRRDLMGSFAPSDDLLSTVTDDPEAMALLRDKRLRMIFYLNSLDQTTVVAERLLGLIRSNRQP